MTEYADTIAVGRNIKEQINEKTRKLKASYCVAASPATSSSHDKSDGDGAHLSVLEKERKIQKKRRSKAKYVYQGVGPITNNGYTQPDRLRHRDFPSVLNRTKGLLPRYPQGYTYQYEYYRQYEIMMDHRKKQQIQVPGNKYYLSVLAIFKNEAHVIEEWIEHHRGHGVDHFYLIDDNSDDDAYKVLDPYITKGLVTMFPTSSEELKFRQGAMYQRVFQDVYVNNETYWLAIIDLDEFLYSPQVVNMKKILKNHEDLSLIGINWLIFGSGGHYNQPNSVTQSFDTRAPENIGEKFPKLLKRYKVLDWSDDTDNDWQKSIVNLQKKIDQVDVHTCVVEGTSDNLSAKRFPNDPPLLINHYIVQSHEFFENVKGRRGDVNNWFSDHARNEAFFEMCDINDIKDTRLKDMNRRYHIAVPPYTITKTITSTENPDWWFADKER